jgi:hypothetical protein
LAVERAPIEQRGARALTQWCVCTVAAEVRRMPDTPDDRRPDLLQLLEELRLLEEDHRALDLRDPASLEKYREKIDALRQKIKSLDGPDRRRPRGHERPGGRPPA